MATVKYSIASKHVLARAEHIKWLYREEPAAVSDNGWRFLALNDNQQFVDNPENLSLCTIQDIVAIFPEVTRVLNFPPGTSLQVVADEAGNITFYDNVTGQPVD